MYLLGLVFMIFVKGFLLKNWWVQCPLSTCSSVKLQEAFQKNQTKTDDLTIYQVLIQYPKWEKDTNIFGLMNHRHLKNFKKNKKTFFIFDASTEGFSTLKKEPFFDILYWNCKNYKIDPRRVIFISANMLDEENIKIYNELHNITKSIKVVTFNNFESMLFGLEGNKIVHGQDPQTVAHRHYEETRINVKARYENKIFLSLSRVNRPHRIMSTYEIFKSDIFLDGLVSHDKLPFDQLKHLYPQLPRGHNITWKEFVRWHKSGLPLTIDTHDFKTNHAMSLNNMLHDTTLFQLVNETFAENWEGTSQFWSEKTFRSIYHMQPFLIWGQQGANKKLQEYGYKLYDEIFDYSFDDEPDDYKRWSLLFEQVQRLVKEIGLMPQDQQVRWRFTVREALIHNFKTLYAEKHTKKVFFLLSKYIRDIADGKETTS